MSSLNGFLEIYQHLCLALQLRIGSSIGCILLCLARFDAQPFMRKLVLQSQDVGLSPCFCLLLLRNSFRDVGLGALLFCNGLRDVGLGTLFGSNGRGFSCFRLLARSGLLSLATKKRSAIWSMTVCLAKKH